MIMVSIVKKKEEEEEEEEEERNTGTFNSSSCNEVLVLRVGPDTNLSL
jgi:hypothetical protein